MSELKPSVLQALDVGKECGLSTLEEAVDNYLNHYTMFFLIAKYSEQYRAFVDELKALNFIQSKKIISISIDEALSVCKEKSNAKKSNQDNEGST